MFCRVLRPFQKFSWVLRCTLTVWGFLKRSEVLSFVLMSSERFLKALRHSVMSWGV